MAEEDLLGEVDCLVAVLSLVEGEDYQEEVDCLVAVLNRAGVVEVHLASVYHQV